MLATLREKVHLELQIWGNNEIRRHRPTPIRLFSMFSEEIESKISVLFSSSPGETTILQTILPKRWGMGLGIIEDLGGDIPYDLERS